MPGSDKPDSLWHGKCPYSDILALCQQMSYAKAKVPLNQHLPHVRVIYQHLPYARVPPRDDDDDDDGDDDDDDDDDDLVSELSQRIPGRNVCPLEPPGVKHAPKPDTKYP
eukprot:6147569-Amphidinium_carterae.1